MNIRVVEMTSFVRAIALQGFDEFAFSQGLDPHTLIAEVGLPRGDPEALISGVKFSALLELCAKRSANPLFGLQFGLQQGTQGLGNLLFAARGADTLGDALKALTHYLHIHSSGAEVHLERQADNARLLYDVVDGDAIVVRQTVELAMGIAARLMQSLLGRAWRPHALLLRHSAGGKPSAYRALLGISPRFASPVNAWVFDAALLETGLKKTDEGLQHLLQRHLEELAQLTLHELPAHIQKLMRNRLADGNVTIEQIAEQIRISPRSLQRYLQTEGTGFQELLDKTRQAVAMRYICDSSISLTQLAGLLGYSNIGAFSRAFARWNGVSPRKWKQLHRQSATS